MKLISVCIVGCLLLSLVGCSTKTPDTIYKTEYQEVKVPVVYKQQRPQRPAYLSDDTAPTYLSKVLEYTTVLEVIIDEQGEKE